MAFFSPLRYPGGKGILAPYFQKVIEENNLQDGEYIEPYAGGAGVALSLLFQEFVSDITINDLSYPIYSFWHSILNKTDEFCEMINQTQVTIDEWKNQKYVMENQKEFSLFEIGFSTFFLNRTNRSGIISGGVIGGTNQKGKWKIDARFNKEDLVNRIKKISMYKDRIQVYNMDAGDLIRKVIPQSPSNTLCYFDPPYYNKGRDLYENYYEDKDHEELSILIKNSIENNWIVTYDNTQEIIDLYKECRHHIYSLSYSAATRYRGSEIMIYSNDLRIPNA